MVSHHSAKYSSHKHYFFMESSQTLRLKPLSLHHNLQFRGLNHYGSEDILVFVCFVALQYHLIKRSSYFMKRSPSR